MILAFVMHPDITRQASGVHRKDKTAMDDKRSDQHGSFTESKTCFMAGLMHVLIIPFVFQVIHLVVVVVVVLVDTCDDWNQSVLCPSPVPAIHLSQATHSPWSPLISRHSTVTASRLIAHRIDPRPVRRPCQAGRKCPISGDGCPEFIC